jgi:signal peptidase I
MRAYDGIKAERGREVTLETPEFLDQAKKLLSRSISIRLRMSGSSMRPAIEDGDIITIEAISDDPVRPGDIVLYRTEQETAVIHRVVRVERSGSDRAVVTRGDGASQNDLPVQLNRVLGRVRNVERAGEPVSMGRPRRSFLYLFFSWFRRFRT